MAKGSRSDIHDDNKILAINSPKPSVGGPYIVVHKNVTDEFWAIVALDWLGEPRLGMRWFYDRIGSPVSSFHPTWFIIPPSLTKTLLAGLAMDHQRKTKIDDFLSGKIKGDKLL